MKHQATFAGPRTPPWRGLRRFIQSQPPAMRCELCSQPLPPQHPHLVEPTQRQILCACPACALLFSQKAETRYRLVPSGVRWLDTFQLNDAQWEQLQIPIGLAFFFHNSVQDRVVAVYPSPAGPTESLLELTAWHEIVAENSRLAGMEADTQALLVNRMCAPPVYCIVPIDECYRLVGILRTRWEGIFGGSRVWEEIDRYFQQLRGRSPVSPC